MNEYYCFGKASKLTGLTSENDMRIVFETWSGSAYGEGELTSEVIWMGSAHTDTKIYFRHVLSHCLGDYYWNLPIDKSVLLSSVLDSLTIGLVYGEKWVLSKSSLSIVILDIIQNAMLEAEV